MKCFPPIALCLVLLLSLGFTRASAQSREIQLCGFTQFADHVVIGATIPPGTRTIIPSTWIQIVPNLYVLLGSGVIIRDPLELNRFIGGLTITNPSDSFQSNPLCSVRSAIEDDNPSIPSFIGTATLLCIGGPTAPFQVTLNLTLTTCDEPDFPGGATSSTPGSQGLIAAGDAPNEYQVK